jgi:2,3,4,5-tetrahydropyridine-2,6-dicarboxylate N-succinyltransferase
MSIQKDIESLYAATSLSKKETQKAEALFKALVKLLNSGKVRAAEKKDGRWQVNGWVKKGILLGFKIGKLKDMSVNKNFRYFDKHTLRLKALKLGDNVREVPGGSSIRDGCYIGRGVICMPPMYVNIGAYVGDYTLIDSNALVGSCAQLGKNIHLSAAAQIGGVLEPVNSIPVIVEDEVMIGGNCGIYEGTIVSRRAVIGAGCILTGSTPVYDTVKGTVYKKTPDNPLIIPENAVVIPGSRALKNEFGIENNLSIYSPIIIKYRDEKTDAATALEYDIR